MSVFVYVGINLCMYVVALPYWHNLLQRF